jgi:hypothetical protein
MLLEILILFEQNNNLIYKYNKENICHHHYFFQDSIDSEEK